MQLKFTSTGSVYIAPGPGASKFIVGAGNGAGTGIDGSNTIYLPIDTLTGGKKQLVRYFTDSWNTTGISNRGENILKPNTQYFVSGFIKRNQSGGTIIATAGITIYNGAGTTTIIGNSTQFETWEYITGTFNTGSAVVNASINLSTEYVSGSSGILRAYFDNIQVEEIGYTNFTDNRTYLSYEETNDTCETQSHCENVQISQHISGIVEGLYMTDGLWGRIVYASSNNVFDYDKLQCYGSLQENCSNGQIRLNKISEGTYEVVPFVNIPQQGSTFEISFDNSTWINFTIKGNSFEGYYPVANITVNESGVLNIFIRKRAGGGVSMDRIRLKPQFVKSYFMNIKQVLGLGTYNWNCRATDDELNTAFASANYTFTIS